MLPISYQPIGIWIQRAVYFLPGINWNKPVCPSIFSHSDFAWRWSFGDDNFSAFHSIGTNWEFTPQQSLSHFLLNFNIIKRCLTHFSVFTQFQHITVTIFFLWFFVRSCTTLFAWTIIFVYTRYLISSHTIWGTIWNKFVSSATIHWICT